MNRIGCDRCGGSGYRGRNGVFEIVEINEEIRELVGRSDRLLLRSSAPHSRTG